MSHEPAERWLHVLLLVNPRQSDVTSPLGDLIMALARIQKCGVEGDYVPLLDTTLPPLSGLSCTLCRWRGRTPVPAGRRDRLVAMLVGSSSVQRSVGIRGNIGMKQRLTTTNLWSVEDPISWYMYGS